MNELQLQSISIFDDLVVGGNNVAGAYYSESQSIKLMKRSIVNRPTSKLVTYSNSDDYELHFLAHEYGHYVADSLEKTLSVKDSDIIQNTLLKYFDGDIFRTKTSNLADVLGSYGARNPQEAFAEAFAEAYTCKEPRKFAKLFKEELEDALEKSVKSSRLEDDVVSMAVKSDKINWPAKKEKILNEQYKKAMEYARGKGIELSGFKQFDGDVQTIIDLIDDADSVAKLYPDIKTGKRKLTIMLDDTLDSKDFAVTRDHIVSINANAFRDTKMLAEEYAKLVEERWFVQGTDYHAIIKHELGHIISNAYNIDGLEIAKKVSGLESTIELKEYLENILSEYSIAYDDGSEIISECFSSVFGSYKKNEFALKLVKECDSIIAKKG